MKALILAGGTGTRLWPMSRDLKPKQFHSFFGNRTMLQHTYERMLFLRPSDIFVATNAQYEALVKKQLPHLPVKNLIIEPAMKDTGPGICFAAHHLHALGFEDEVMAVIYADHLIQKPGIFAHALQYAEHHIQKTNGVSVIAVRAKYPNPNLGYIKIGKSLEEEKDFEVYELAQFVEKPDGETAKKFLESYKYLWNTGLYVWKVKSILELFKKFAPDIWKSAKSAETYSSSPKISVDYAVMEKIDPRSVHVIPADLGWNDIGNWAALYDELALAEKENVATGHHMGIDTEGSVVLGNSGKLIVTYGVKDMVIVETDEAILVMPKEKAAEMKKVVEQLKKEKKEKYL